MAMRARQRAQADLGAGTFVYEAAQAVDNPDITLWRMSLYGLEAGGGPRTPHERSSYAYAISVPNGVKASEALLALFRR